MTSRPLKSALLTSLSLAGLCVGATAHADTPRVFKGIDFDASNTEIQLDTRVIDDDLTGTSYKVELQGEYALSDRWSIGAEFGAERDAMDSWETDAVRIRAKWKSARNAQGLAFAVQGGVGRSFKSDANVLDLRLYAGWKKKDWSVVGRIDAERELRSLAETEYGYRLQAVHGISKKVDLGLEFSGDLASGTDAKHRAGPFVAFPLSRSGATRLEVGAYAALNDETPDMTYRIKLNIEL